MESLKPNAAQLSSHNTLLGSTSAGFLVRIGACLVLAGLMAGVFLVGSTASSLDRSQAAAPGNHLTRENSRFVSSARGLSTILRVPQGEAFLPVSTSSVETIATFAADCTTPKSSFVLGETVCAKTDGVDLGFPGGRWVHWLRPNLSIAFGGSGTTLITVNPQTFTYIPDTVGTWKATIAETGDISQTPAVFTVSSTPLATYKSGCLQAESSFTLGNTVCARVTGVDPVLNRRLYWIDPAGNLRAATAITSDGQTDSFTLPTAATEVIGNDVVNNTGTWKVNIVSSRGSAVFSVLFTVAGATPTADVGVAKAIIGASPDAGANFTFFVAVTNYGPSDAANVVLTDPQPVNATFVSPVVQTAGPGFSCLGSNPVVCTRALGLAVGETATFEITYTAGSSGNITNIATVHTDTPDPNPANDTGSYGPITINGGGGDDSSCTLDCPADMVVTATSPSGAVVDFSAGFVIAGNCGGVNAIPDSGSLFPVGTTTVNVNSTTGNASCSFHVTVVDSAAPTITCPLPTLTANAANGQTETTVAVSAPAATGTCVLVTGSRDDDAAVNDPYPVGTTVITWTATEILENCPPPSPPPDFPPPVFGRTASCSQIVTVLSGDTPTITCPTDKIFNTADCAYTATTAEIAAFTPTTTGNLATPDPGETNPAAVRSDHLALTAPFPAGVTVITWTATDTVGRVVSCSQNITVNSTGDHTPPTFVNTPETPLPPDLNVTTTNCSAVLLDDELGVVTASDTCSAVSITRTGVPLTVCILPNICPIDCSAQFGPGKTCNENFFFPIGTTNITYTAKDAAGNTATFTQHVTVRETTPPTFTVVPGDVGPFYTGVGATSCDTFVGDATLGTATVSDNCDTTVIRSGVPAGNIFPVGDTVVTYTAKADITVTRTQHVTVVDNTLPVVTAPGPVTLSTGVGATSCGVTVTDLNGTFGTGSATDNCPGVGAVTRSGMPAGNVFPLGPTTLTYSATDAHGNTGSATQVVTVIDNTAPVITCPTGIVVHLPLNSTATSMAVSYPAATATDNCTGAITFGYNIASGSVFPVGPTTVTVTATDAHGNSSSCQFTVTVLYNFTGFFSPVGNPPVLNSVKAGQAIPVKFSLSGNKGLDIFAANNPYTISLNCATNDPGVDVTETVNAGGSSLNFGGDQYNYVWKTESSWAGTCRQLVVTLNDGSVHVANFKFK